MSSTRLRQAALFLTSLLLALAALTGRAVIEGEQQMAESDRAFNAGDLRGATVHARRAAVMYAPGAPHVSRAFERLVAIAVGSEAAGNAELAELGWGAVRGAALETRHIWVPFDAELKRANANLARIGSTSESALVAQTSPEQLHEQAARALARDDAPRAIWVSALIAGFLLAVVGLGVTARFGVQKDGRFVIAEARLGLLLGVVGAALFAIAAWRA
jgi:hypothetical protein